MSKEDVIRVKYEIENGHPSRGWLKYSENEYREKIRGYERAIQALEEAKDIAEREYIEDLYNHHIEIGAICIVDDTFLICDLKHPFPNGDHISTYQILTSDDEEAKHERFVMFRKDGNKYIVVDTDGTFTDQKMTNKQFQEHLQLAIQYICYGTRDPKREIKIVYLEKTPEEERYWATLISSDSRDIITKIEEEAKKDKLLLQDKIGA